MVYRFVRRLRLRARSLFRRSAVERELDAELRAYLDEIGRRASGPDAGPGAARESTPSAAGFVRIKEACRDAWGTSPADDWARDVRYGLRSLWRSPAFTAAALLTLAIGIGASVAMFGQVNAVFLATLPVEEPQGLWLLDWTPQGSAAPRRYNPTNRLSYSAYRALEEHATALSGVACWSGAFTNFGAHDRVETHVVSGSYFTVLGVRAAAGRPIVPADERAGGRVAVISHALWRRVFGGEASAVGATVRVNGELVEIVGVAPREFIGLNPARAADLYLPLSMYAAARFDGSVPRSLQNDRDWTACDVAARLAPGASPETARAQAEQLVAAVPFATERRAGPMVTGGPGAPDVEQRHIRLVPALRGTDDLRAQTVQPLRVLMGAAILLLVVASANVGGLLLARVPARAHEVAARLALGASRARIARQLAVESLLLALAAGAIGTLLAHALNAVLPGLLGRFAANGADIARVAPATDARVLLFALAVSLASGIGFGLWPAIAATRGEPLEALRRLPPRGAAGAPRTPGGKVLVAAQVALALLLLVGAGLLVRTIGNLRSSGDEETLLRQLHFSVSPAQSGYRPAQLRPLVENLVKAMEEVPTVAAASAQGATGLCIPGREGEQTVVANTIAPGAFAAAGTPLLAGRDFTWDDREGRPGVAIVNQAFANTYLGGRRAVGEVLTFCRTLPPRTIVGVAGDRDVPGDVVRPLVYIPFVQPPPAGGGAVIAFTLRTAGDPLRVVSAVRGAVASLAPAVPVFDVETGLARRERGITRERQITGFASVYGLLALLMACVGVYGLMAYTVFRRQGEIGVRIALGAEPGAVASAMVRESLVPVAAGLGAGLVIAIALTRWMDALLVGVSRTDPVTIGAALVLLMTTAAGAAWLPARRAARIDPIRALRTE